MPTTARSTRKPCPRSGRMNPPQMTTPRMRDAELRAADCFFALKSFNQAAGYYDRVLERDVEPLVMPFFSGPCQPSWTKTWKAKPRAWNNSQGLPQQPARRRSTLPSGSHAHRTEPIRRRIRFNPHRTALGHSTRQASAGELCLVGVTRQDDKVLAFGTAFGLNMATTTWRQTPTTLSNPC